jgi:hypothetical protein
VKVAETGSTGTGIGAVSSAGAQGPFQFIPETAAAYHVDVNNFRSSAMGAAKLLSDLKKQYGSWGAALEHYSGGGYGLEHVKEKSVEGGVPVGTGSKKVLTSMGLPGQNPLGELLEQFVQPGVPGTPGGDLKQLNAPSFGLGFPNELLEASQAVTKFLTLLTDPKFWIRAGMAIGGLILLYISLKALTGTSASDLPGSGIVKAAAFKRLPPKMRTTS